MLFCRGRHRGCLVAVDAVDANEGVVRGEAREVVGYFFLGFAGAVCVVGGVGDAELAFWFGVGRWMGVSVWVWVWMRVVMVMVVVWLLLVIVLMIMIRRWRGRKVIRIRYWDWSWSCYFGSSCDCDCDCWSFILALDVLVVSC